jgi:HEAT repeat protein
LAHLHDPDALAGDRVAAALGTVGDLSAVPALMSGLDSSDEDVRSRSAAALGFLKASMATARLNEVMRKDGPAACRSAAEALARIGTPEAMTALLGPLGDAGMTPARHAAMIGLEVAGDRAGAPLALALNASDPTLRRNSAEMLGYLRQPASTPALARSLSDSEPAVRSQAAWALGEIGTQDAQTALAEVLASETDAASRQAATQALARARSLGDGKEPVSAAFGEQLLGPLPRIPAGRWTMLLLSLALSAALLLAGAHRAHPRAH